MKKIYPQIVLVLSFTISSASLAQEAGWKASQETVEKLSKSRSEFNYYEEKVPAYSLPDLLTSQSGKKISSSRDWTKIRRPELVELFRLNLYGRVPSTPYNESFKIVNEDKQAMGGASTLKQVEITINSEGKSLVINLTLFIPNKTAKPSPAFLLIDNRGPQNTDPLRKVKSEFWPAEEIVARGYAAAVFSNSDVDPDNFDDFKNGIHSILDRGTRTGDSWGTIAAWAWGASRCMDYLVSDKSIDKNRVAVVGHSRGGKTALWAGAEDERFAIIVGNESGCGGAAIARRKFGETVERINRSFPHWFCTNYRNYNKKENDLPVDMHMLLALTAPRALYIDAASDDLWGDPKGCYLALVNSLSAFRLFGIKSELPSEVPPLNKQVISGKVGFHIRDGEHNMKLQDWNLFMDFADKVLK